MAIRELDWTFFSQKLQGKQLDVDPRACIGSFFDRIQVAEIEYKKHFDLEVESFKERIKKRAAEKVEIALAEQEVSKYSLLKWQVNQVSFVTQRYKVQKLHEYS